MVEIVENILIVQADRVKIMSLDDTTHCFL